MKKLAIACIIILSGLHWHYYNAKYLAIKNYILSSNISNAFINQIGLDYTKKILIGPIMLVGVSINMILAIALAYLYFNRKKQILVLSLKFAISIVGLGFFCMILFSIIKNQYLYQVAFHFTHTLLSPIVGWWWLVAIKSYHLLTKAPASTKPTG